MKTYYCIVLLALSLFSCNRNLVDGPLEEVSIDELLLNEIELTLNPSGLTPLSALMTLSTNTPTQITTTVLGDYESNTITESYHTSHVIPVHGLYSGQNNQIKIEVLSADNTKIAYDTLSLQTDSLPDFFPKIEIVEKDESMMEPGWNLFELSIGGLGYFRFHPSIFDPSGEVRWYMNLDFIQGWIGPFERLNNGNWIWGNNNAIYEYDMLGREVNSWGLGDNYQHHDFAEKPNGNLIIPVSKTSVTTRLDYLIELNRSTGTIVREWNLNEVLDVDRFDFNWNSSDWAHVNSVWYDEATDGLVISARNQGIVKVDMENNLEWILAPHQGWGLAGVAGDGHDTNDFLLNATDSDGVPYEEEVQLGIADDDTFSWPWGQHAAMVLANGNLFCFDNGSNKNFNGNGEYIRGVEYSIDIENKTCTQVWQYGKERGPELYSSNISDVDLLPTTGNRLISPGNINNEGEQQSRIIEVNYSQGQVVFEALITFKNALATGGGWGEFDLSYRAERIELYPEEK